MEDNGNGNQLHIQRCPVGEQLYQAWTVLLEGHAGMPAIYPAMQAYFQHKNGIQNFQGKVLTPRCWGCHFEDKGG